jgi:hypothetical protein
MTSDKNQRILKDLFLDSIQWVQPKEISIALIFKNNWLSLIMSHIKKIMVEILMFAKADSLQSNVIIPRFKWLQYQIILLNKIAEKLKNLSMNIYLKTPWFPKKVI